jgi:hypothetical protein
MDRTISRKPSGGKDGNMTHQPYEKWIFSDRSGSNLNHQEVTALQNHLNDCQSCRLLYDAWNEVEQELVPTSMLAPQPGFADRWQVRLQADRLKTHQRQTLTLLVISVTGALLLLGIMLNIVLPWIQTPRLLLWTWLYQLIRLFSIVGFTRGFIGALSNSVVNLIPLYGWIILTGLLSELAVIWVVSYRVLSNSRRVS